MIVAQRFQRRVGCKRRTRVLEGRLKLSSSDDCSGHSTTD